jgi:GMP synthase-like glutamine amidotransferase
MSGSSLRVGLLQCGHIHPDLVAAHGDYPEAFAALLAGTGIELVTYDVTLGPPPASVAECDAWLVSGSAASTYDPQAWIAPVERFLRSIVEAEAPMVAVCFGHQLLAQAMGGRVARSEAGWGVGAHEYELVGEPLPWMDGAPESGRVRLIASHQDQVVELPDGAVVIARTDHCPVAAYTLGPRALAIQPHPEFTPAVSRGLVERRVELIGRERAEAALATLDAPLDQALVGRWMARFLGSPV